MPTLYLMRHAKSDRSLDMEDIDRPLNSRGREAAIIMAHHLKEQGLPEAILCSSASRTRETVIRMYHALKMSPPVIFHRTLYLATPGEILRTIHTHAPKHAESIMVVGHNPSISQLALLLIKNGDPKTLETMRTKYPTAALTTLDVNLSNWSELEAGSATLKKFITPEMGED